jgi:F-BAR domain only protein
MGPATRRSNTVRGRRDVRNTIYAPAPTSSDGQGHLAALVAGGMVPGLPATTSFASSRHGHGPVAALASEASVAGSDTQSVRSGNSLGSVVPAKHPELMAPGLQASIIETVHVQFEGGEVKSASIAGEIAFVSNHSDDNMFKSESPTTFSSTRMTNTPPARETIRINNFPNLERIGPNRIFVQNASLDQPDQFYLELSHIQKTSTAFSYRVFAPEGNSASALGKHAPLLLTPLWKPQGDKLGLLLQYQLNPDSNLTGPVILRNLALVATYDGRASGAQTKPSGTHLKDKHLVYWRLGDTTLTRGDAPQKIVCRIVGAEGTAPTPGHVEARWECIAPPSSIDDDDEFPPVALASGISISRLGEPKGKGKIPTPADDPFSDEGSSGTPPQEEQSWVDVPLARKLISGKYESRGQPVETQSVASSPPPPPPTSRFSPLKTTRPVTETQSPPKATSPEGEAPSSPTPATVPAS